MNKSTLTIYYPNPFISCTRDMMPVVEEIRKSVWAKPWFSTASRGEKVGRELYNLIKKTDIFYFIWGNRPGSAISKDSPHFPIVHWEYTTYDCLNHARRPNGVHILFWGKQPPHEPRKDDPDPKIKLSREELQRWIAHSSFLERLDQGLGADWICRITNNDVLDSAQDLDEDTRKGLSNLMEQLATSYNPGELARAESSKLLVKLLGNLIFRHLSKIIEDQYWGPVKLFAQEKWTQPVEKWRSQLHYTKATIFCALLVVISCSSLVAISPNNYSAQPLYWSSLLLLIAAFSVFVTTTADLVLSAFDRKIEFAAGEMNER